MIYHDRPASRRQVLVTSASAALAAGRRQHYSGSFDLAMSPVGQIALYLKLTLIDQRSDTLRNSILIDIDPTAAGFVEHY